MYNKDILDEKITKDIFYKKDINTLKTIQEKMIWLNVNNLSEQKINCTDKILVKEYAKSILNKDICPKTYKIYDNIDDIDISKLPNKFILKINNGCAKNIFCYNKKKFNLEKYKDTLKIWLNKIPGINTHEYQYTAIKPKLFTEELLINNKHESLIDYRFWCFNNSVKFIAINCGHGWGGQYFVDRDFNKINIYNSAHPFKDNEFKKPNNFNEMIDISEKLSKPFKFVRVDLYNINEKIYLGEMTFSPSGYTGHFITNKGENKDIYYGNLLKI